MVTNDLIIFLGICGDKYTPNIGESPEHKKIKFRVINHKKINLKPSFFYLSENVTHPSPSRNRETDNSGSRLPDHLDLRCNQPPTRMVIGHLAWVGGN